MTDKNEALRLLNRLLEIHDECLCNEDDPPVIESRDLCGHCELSAVKAYIEAQK